MTSPASTTPRSYLDFQGLAGLRGEAARSPDQAVRRTAEQFEAYFIQQMMKSMRATVEKSDLVENGNMEMYQDLMDKEVSLHMVRRGGMGLADMLEKQMLQQQQLQQPASLSTQDALKLHPTATQATPLPLVPPAQAMPLKPESSKGLPLPRTSGFELQRRMEGLK